MQLILPPQGGEPSFKSGSSSCSPSCGVRLTQLTQATTLKVEPWVSPEEAPNPNAIRITTHRPHRPTARRSMKGCQDSAAWHTHRGSAATQGVGPCLLSRTKDGLPPGCSRCHWLGGTGFSPCRFYSLSAELFQGSGQQAWGIVERVSATSAAALVLPFPGRCCLWMLGSGHGALPMRLRRPSIFDTQNFL